MIIIISSTTEQIKRMPKSTKPTINSIDGGESVLSKEVGLVGRFECVGSIICNVRLG